MELVIKFVIIFRIFYIFLQIFCQRVKIWIFETLAIFYGAVTLARELGIAESGSAMCAVTSRIFISKITAPYL